MATQYGHYRILVLNSQGQPINGAAVALRKQGATVNGLHSGAQTVFTVNDPGAVTTTPGDTVRVGTGAIERAVTAFGATSVTVASPGFTDVPDDARLTVTNNLPTLYNDAQGAETKSNPLSTDANGIAECWAEIRPYDVHVSGGSDPNGQPAPEALYQDEAPTGIGRVLFHDFPGAATAQTWKAFRQFTGTDRYLSIRNADNVEDFAFKGNGGFTLGKAGSTESCTINGNVNQVGALAVSGNLTHSSGTLTLQAASVITSFLAANAVHPAPSTITGSATDIAATTTEAVVTGLTTSYTPVSGNVGVRVCVNLPYYVEGSALNAGGYVEVRLYVGGVLKARGIFGNLSGANEIARSRGTVSFTWEEPTMAASPTTIEVRHIRVDTAGTVVATYKGTIYAGYMTIQEFKK